MDKKYSKKVMVSSRQTHSELSATGSYRNYHHKIKRFFSNVNPFNKTKKY